mmetsp:Transcript_33536/g.54347  ORF Transcript_33536/g.54347 Transcript_33536/m.54347 type:complete len:170 (-) Transcript_33536:1213-1722(-)
MYPCTLWRNNSDCNFDTAAIIIQVTPLLSLSMPSSPFGSPWSVPSIAIHTVPSVIHPVIAAMHTLSPVTTFSLAILPSLMSSSSAIIIPVTGSRSIASTTHVMNLPILWLVTNPHCIASSSFQRGPLFLFWGSSSFPGFRTLLSLDRPIPGGLRGRDYRGALLAKWSRA